MRYVVAIIFAIAAAATCSVFLGEPVASWVVDQYKFDSPDDVNTMHSAVFLGTGLVGMLIGWTIGWAAGALLAGADRGG